MRLSCASICLILLISLPVSAQVVQSLPGDCDNSGVVDLADYAQFAIALQYTGCGARSGCRCFDLNSDGCINLLDFSIFQSEYGKAMDASGPAPNNVFVKQLAD